MKKSLKFLVWGSGLLLTILFIPPAICRTPVSRKPLIKPVVDRQYLPVVLELIDGAQQSIDFIQLEFHYDPTVKKIQDALRGALKRGVVVRGILEDSIRFNPTSKHYLNRFGIETILDTPEKMTHNKLFIIDGEQVLLGSTNLTSNSIDNNNETNVYVKDRRLGAFFRSYFEQLWRDSSAEPKSETLKLPGVGTVINRQHFDTLFGLLNSAQKRIWVLMYGMSYNANYPGSKPNRLIDSLIAARKRGIEVRVILDRSDYNDFLNRVNETTRQHLEAGGVTVRYDCETITSHAKLVIVDDTAVIGSLNWGYKALERRNECSLIISVPDTVASFVNYFSRIWEESAPGPEKGGGQEPIDTLPAESFAPR